MSLFDFLLESKRNPRKQINTPSTNRESVGDYGSSVVGMEKYNVWDLISKLRDLNDGYKYRYQEYQMMEEEVTIQSAIELYADDATQVDTKTERIVNIQSDDKTLQSDLNEFLSSVHVDSSVWNWAYSVSQYGDFYLRLHINEEDKTLFIDDDTDPAYIMDLYEYGQRVGFAEEDTSDYKNLKHRSNPNGLDLIIYSPDKFVHFMIKKSARYDSLEIPIREETDENGDPLIRKFTVVRGVSMLEGVRSIYRILQLLEDSLLAARIAKAEFVRVFNIEVGDSTPRQTTEIVNTVKNLFDSKATFDTNSGRYVSTKAYRPIGDPIFNPTRNGKGAVSHENIGGDFQVRDIADIDYFKNKLFSGLKVPKAILGYEECFRYDTKVTLLNGKTYEIGYMAEHPDEFIGLGILSCSPDGTIVPTRIVHVKKTRLNASFVRVHLDNGEHIDVTPDHLMMLRDGSFQEAGSLAEGDSLMPNYTEYRGGRKYIKDNSVSHTRWIPQYRLVAKYLLNEGVEVPSGYQVHHRDRIKCNDDPTNLEILSTSDHCVEHHRELHASYKSRNYHHSEETKQLIKIRTSQALKGIRFSDEHKMKISSAAKRSVSKHFKSGDDNILRTSELARQRHSESRKAYFANGGQTWQKSCNDPDKVREWNSKVEEARWPADYERKIKSRVVYCDKCGERFEKPMNDYEYECYLNGRKNCYCSKECTSSSLNFDRARKLYRDLLDEYGFVDKSLYELHRPRGFLRYETLIDRIEEINYRRSFNHKVVRVETLDVIEDAYDLGVEHENHTFALAAGVYVHNSLPGGLGDNTLTRLDIRYSRSVKRVQNALILGIADLCNIWLRLNSRDADVGNFKVILQAPSTAEELGRLTEFSMKMGTLNEIVSTMSNTYGEYINIPKVFKALFDKYINYPDLVEALEPELNDAIKKYEAHIEEEEQRRKAELEQIINPSTDPDIDSPFEDDKSQSGEEDYSDE